MLESISERGKWDLFTEAANSRMLFGLVQTPSELAECPQLESRDFYREVDHPVIGKIRGAGGTVQPVADSVPVPDAGADAGAAQPGDLRRRAGATR